MNISFTYNDHEEARALAEVAEQKLQTLKKFTANSQSVLCEVEFNKVAANQKGNIFSVSANLEVDGQLYRAEATEESFEAAIDEVKAELDKELRREKGKRDTLRKKAGRALKRVLRR